MKLREIAVAVAAFSLAGAAVAAGNDTQSTTSERMPTARQGQPLEQSTQAQQEQKGTSNLGNAAGTSASSMGNANASKPANPGSQGSMASEEHNPQLVRSVQEALKQKGYDIGTVDGQLGPNTESALRQFQQAQGISQSGNLDQQTLSALGVDQNASAQGSNASSPSNGASSGNTSSAQTSQGNSSNQGSAYK
jgi:peptidoglycan hydrolase-like protein with peptidoglycan-binding domain